MFKLNTRKIKHALIFISIILLFSSVIMPFADGNTPKYTPESFDGKGESLKKTAYTMAYRVYGPLSAEEELISTLKMSFSFDGAGNSYVSGDIPTKSAGIADAQKGIWDTAVTVYEKIKTIGFLIAMLYFLIDLLDRTMKETLTVEHFIRQFIKLMIALLFVNNGMYLFQQFVGFSSSFIELVGGPDTNPTTNVAILDEIGDNLKDVNFISGVVLAFGYIAMLAVPWLGLQAAKVIIWFFAWARFIELGIRIAFAPIGMADVFTDGFHGNGYRYFKKIIAVMLQGVFILLILKLCQGINGAFYDDGQLEGFSQLIVPLTEIGLIKRSQSFANEMLGVG